MSDVVKYWSSPKHNAIEALRSLAEASGLPLSRIVELAGANRLNDLFDVETRSLKYRNGGRIPQHELRALTTAKQHYGEPMSGRDAVAEMMRKRPGDPHAKRRNLHGTRGNTA